MTLQKTYLIRPPTPGARNLYADWLWVAVIKRWVYQLTLPSHSPSVYIKNTVTNKIVGGVDWKLNDL